MAGKMSLSWLITEQGRTFTHYATTTVGLGILTAKFLPQTFFLDKYKAYVHSYQDSVSTPLSNELRKRYEKCLEIVKIGERQRKLIEPFVVKGFDTFNAGSCIFKFGAIIGIPNHFNYKSEGDIDIPSLQIGNERTGWVDLENKLKDCLVLSEKEQEVAICRELLATQNMKILLDGCYIILCFSAAGALSEYANKRLNLYFAPIYFRIVLYILSAVLGTSLYFLLINSTDAYYQRDMDQKLAEVGPEFVQSAVTLYDKLLRQNDIRSQIKSKDDESILEKFLQLNFMFRQPHEVLMQRKQFFVEKQKELNNNINLH